MPDLYPFARRLLWRLEPETAHKVALRALRLGLGFLAAGEQRGTPDHPSLAQSLWGLRFENPVGIAAGFDKDAVVPDELLQVGFGSVEVGTITPKPQTGNPAPRLFRLERDSAIINRLGFPSAGFDVVSLRLAQRQKTRGVLGVNLGKNRDSAIASLDYAEGIRRMAPLADYLVINVSSPNTPGLRDLQRRSALEALMTELIAVRDATKVGLPLLIKIAPDLSQEELSGLASVALDLNIDGIIIGNTTLQRPGGLDTRLAGETGGLSGMPLFELSTRVLFEMYRLTSGRVPLIGAGGVSGGREAYHKIRAGASLVQLYTALVFSGVGLVTRIKQELVALLAADGFSNIAEAIGADHRDPRTQHHPIAPASGRSAA